MAWTKKIWVSLWLLVFMASAAQATVTIRITQGVDSPTKIAVVPFLNNTGSGDDMAAIISNNLSLSGRFNPMSRNRFPGLPSSEQAISFRDWRLVQQDYVVIGRMETLSSGQLQVTMELFDVFTGQRAMPAQVLRVDSAAGLRDLAHRFSDQIFERITGTKGIFSTKLAYVVKDNSGRREEYRIEVADWDGARAAVVYRSPQPIISLAWSPDASKIAFVNFNNIGLSQIRELRLANNQVRDLVVLDGINGAPAYSPDGSELAFVSSHQGAANIYVQQLSSGRVTQVTDHWAIDTEPTWTRDGRNLIFTSDRGGAPQLYQASKNGGNAQRISFTGNYNARPQMSADGRYLIHVHANQGNFNIAAMNMETRDLRILTQTEADESPSLAPNGSMLVYATRQQGTGVLAWVSVDGQVRSSMPATRGDVREPSWSPYISF